MAADTVSGYENISKSVEKNNASAIHSCKSMILSKGKGIVHTQLSHHIYINRCIFSVIVRYIDQLSMYSVKHDKKVIRNIDYTLIVSNGI